MRVKNQTEKICLEAVKETTYALRLVKDKTEKIYLESFKDNLDAAFLVNINERNVVLIMLNSSLQHKNKNKEILTKIIKKFNKDREVVDFYTKYNLWKYVDFSKVKLNNELIKHSIIL